MTKLNIDSMLHNRNDKFNPDGLQHLDGLQADPSKLISTEFQQDYNVIIRKKKYFASTYFDNSDYVRLYNVNSFVSLKTSVNVFGRPGSCSITIQGGQKIICADREDQDIKAWGKGEQGFEEMIKGWNSSVADNNIQMGEKGFFYNGILYEDIIKLKEARYGWRIAEKCDWEPMDEIYVFARSRKIRDINGEFKMIPIFFGYISQISKTYTSGKTAPLITIAAEDQLKLLSISYLANTPTMSSAIALSGAHLDKDFTGNLIIDDSPIPTPNGGPELAAPMFTEPFAGRYPYEIIVKCCRDAGIPEKYLQQRIEKIKRVPFMPKLKDQFVEMYASDLKSRLSYCQTAAEKLFVEFYADEEGNIVLKIPNYTLGVNRLSANNYNLDTVLDENELLKIDNAGVIYKQVEKTKTVYENVTTNKVEEITHTVVYGDCLWNLAKKYFGDPLKWPEIYRLNTNILKNPNWIYPGQVLIIKKGSSTTKKISKEVKEIVTEKIEGEVLTLITDKYIRCITDDEIISFTLTDTDKDVCNMVEVQYEMPPMSSSSQAPPPAVKRATYDWQSIIQFGMRPSNGTISTPLLDSTVGPTMFGAFLMQKSLSERFKGTLTIIEESSIRVGDPIRFNLYDDHPYRFKEDYVGESYQAIFYVNAIDRSISTTGVSTMTLSLTAGRVLGMQSIYDKWAELYKHYFEEVPIMDITQDLQKAQSGSNSYNTDFNTNFVVGGSSKVNAIINYTKKYLGVKYVWGGESMAEGGFDCSGLLQYCFGQFGVKLPRVSQDQCRVGKYVPPNQLQPGDIVCYGNPATHVGLCIGNGYMIHAPHTGDVVKISPYNYRSGYYGRRVL